MSNLLDMPMREVVARHPDPVVIKGMIAQHELDMRKRDDDLKRIEQDPFFFATNFIYTKNEDTLEVGKYPAFPFLQNVVFPEMETTGYKLWEKTQRMLITISFCVFYLYKWLMPGLFLGWMTSRNENKVDDGGSSSTWESLFGKIRFMYDELHARSPWVIEHFIGSVPNSSRLFSYMRLENPRTKSTISGEAPVPNTPSGGGYGMALVDEAALTPNMHVIHGNVIMASKSVHYVSYPNGMNNTFYKIKETKGHFGFKIVRIHWSMHPNRDQNWRDAEARKLTKSEAARRLDIDYSESTEARVFPNFIREKHVVENLEVDINLCETWWDFGSVDATAPVFVQINTEEIGGKMVEVLRFKKCVELWNTNYDEVSKACHSYLMEMDYAGGSEKTYEEMSDAEKAAWHKKTLRIQGVGDPQVRTREVSTGIRLQDRYKSRGFNIEPAPYHDTKATLETIDVWIKEGRVFVDSEADEIINAFERWEWPKNPDQTRKPNVTQPEHSKVSHTGKAIEYGFAKHFMQKHEVKETMTLMPARSVDEVLIQ
jgi:hypothetical protein